MRVVARLGYRSLKEMQRTLAHAELVDWLADEVLMAEERAAQARALTLTYTDGDS